ncbi:hypothetical protein F5B22DRAFT_654571 [Xylaria bambusicola]|uniref:uncharacterized protein n=1 Tax=Xylaria bambusicola TaxID=326684 RepID=UPI0020089324|nr:uncharacterized protein F5B22DRAFT_654571 [Xylaria bambusicola]KAI0517794.1 hypothetical protein F5B22DRAFT_654571 [Xylaria bambusicola]
MAGSIYNPEVVALIALSTILTSISFIIVVSRCVIRFFMIFKPGMDDCMIIGALIFTIAYEVAIYVIKIHGGVGMPITTLSFTEMATFLKATFAIELIYYTIVFCIKTSIIFMYQRFAIWDTFKKLCLGTNILLFTFYVVCIGATLGQCTPLEKAWDVTRALPGTCINTTAFFYFTSGFNILTDAWILLLPIPTLRSLKISRRSRYVLYGIFGIGSLATAMSCVRLYSIHIYTLAKDPFKDGVLVNLWSMVEVNIAIVCASIPALKPLVSPRKLLNERRQRRGYSSHITEPLSYRPSKISGFSSMSHSRITKAESTNRVSSPVSLPPEDETSGISLPLQTL